MSSRTEQPMITTAHSSASQLSPRRRTVKRALLFAIDFVVPLALFYGLTSAGADLYVALVVSTVISSISAFASLFVGERRRLSFWTVMSFAALGVAFVSGSDRFLLAKESVLTAAAGAWFLLSIRTERPLAYQFTRAMLEGRAWFTPRPWEQLWRSSPRFRRIWRVSSAMWGVATLIDAVLRVVMAYTLPVQTVPALSTAMFVGTLVVMQVITHVYYARAGLWRILQGHDDG